MPDDNFKKLSHIHSFKNFNLKKIMDHKANYHYQVVCFLKKYFYEMETFELSQLLFQWTEEQLKK